MKPTQLLRSLFATRKPRPRTVRLGLDNLERRDTPSGTVTGSVHGKTWIISGDNEANDISIEPSGAGSFTIVANGTTTVAGDAEPFDIENIIIKLKQGADSVSINKSTLGHNTLVGFLNIDGGSEENSVYIVDMTFNKFVSIKNGTNTTGQDFANIVDSTILGKLTITNGNGNGDSRTVIHRTTAGTSSLGALAVSNGVGRDLNEVSDSDVNGNVKISNGKPDAGGAPGRTQFYNSHNDTAQSQILGNVTVNYVGGAEAAGERDGIWDYSIDGNMSFNYGQGQGDLRFDGFTVDFPPRI